MIYGNNLVQTRSYDLDYRLTQLMTINGSVHQDLTQVYDDANNITTITNALDNTRSQTLVYDDLNRLTDATSHYGDVDYAYDAIGNRLSEAIDAQSETYTYDVNSHRLEETNDGGTITYSYDANGNTLDNTTNTFTFGDNNRMKTSGVGGSISATYTYNGRGERVKKDSINTTYYHYDQGGQLIAETDATGTTQVEYIYIDGQPTAIVTSGSLNFIHNDHLGTPQQISDAIQTIVWQADYDPFGNATITTGTITNNIRFPGQYYDEETGLHYNFYRYYDPSLGRYITSDPIGLVGGFNTYGYSLLNPITNTDPYGLCPICPLLANPGTIAALGKAAAYTTAILGGLALGEAMSGSDDDNVVPLFPEDKPAEQCPPVSDTKPLDSCDEELIRLTQNWSDIWDRKFAGEDTTFEERRHDQQVDAFEIVCPQYIGRVNRFTF